MRKKINSLLLAVLTACCLEALTGTNLAHAESTINCPSGTYDMLDWMTLDSDLPVNSHMTGTANPLYTDILSGKFYWTKGGAGGGAGFPWDIQLYDNNFIYVWITEYWWNDPDSYKTFGTRNMPLTARCAKGGGPDPV